MATGVLALLGSGETAPGMTKIHREIFARVQPSTLVSLDTAYGFQGNVPQMTEKLVDYFATSLHVAVESVHFDSFERASEVDRAIFRQRVREADYVFAGPGSPSYALTQWRPLNLGDDLFSVLERGGGVCFASAAALTLGAYTAPIYEIYKVGVAAPYWLEGLDIMSRIGLRCVVIPHFDNHEGRNYDTRFCYLGERNLTRLESQLPDDVATLGVDEHTALIIDLAADTLTVRGRGQAYWRRGSSVLVLPHGQVTPLSDLRTSETAPRHSAATAPPDSDSDLAALARVALTGGEDAADAVATLVRRAAASGDGHVDPSPYIEAVVAARTRARSSGAYELADDLRAALIDLDVEINDDASGTTWSRRTGA